MHATVTHQLIHCSTNGLDSAFNNCTALPVMSSQSVSTLTKTILENCLNHSDSSVDIVCSSQAPSAAETEAALPLLHKVPYSLHSSYSELESFVAHLRPEAIVPIVKKCYDSRYPIDPDIHFKHLLRRAMPVNAQQHGQTCGRGRKRKFQGRAKREDGADEKGDWCWQHGKWQVCICCMLPCRILPCHTFDVLQAYAQRRAHKGLGQPKQSNKLRTILKCQLQTRPQSLHCFSISSLLLCWGFQVPAHKCHEPCMSACYAQSYASCN